MTYLLSRSKPIFIIVLALIFGWACSGKKKAYKAELTAKASQEFPNNPEFDYHIFQSDADSVTFFFRINTEKLLYARSNEDELTAIVFIEISLRTIDNEGPKVTPKIIKFVDADETRTSKILQAQTKMKVPTGYVYKVEFLVKDQQRQQTFPHTAKLDRAASSDRTHFLVKVDSNDVVLFGDRVAANVRYHIASKAANAGVNQIRVDYYRRDFPLPPPPFITYDPAPFEYKPDSTFYLAPDADAELAFVPAAEGFYHFRSDVLTKDGLTLFVSGAEFPKVTTVKNMIEPVRYLLSNSEYKRVDNGTYNRGEFEKIWINWAGTKDRAKLCIEAYYERVAYSNQQYSSHVDGWKSDRGLVYVVYGKPNKVYKTDLAERWIYGEENNPLSVTFNFVLVINPFTPNDFRLNREEYYKPAWYRAVNAWRDGRIY